MLTPATRHVRVFARLSQKLKMCACMFFLCATMYNGKHFCLCFVCPLLRFPRLFIKPSILESPADIQIFPKVCWRRFKYRSP